MLQRVRIQNFKSLKDVTLDLQKVNLFIGPNNSGKSNFLKGLEFVGMSFTDYEPSDFQQITFSRNKDLRIKIIFSNLTDNIDFFNNEKKIENFLLEINKGNNKVGTDYTNTISTSDSLGNPTIINFDDNINKIIENHLGAGNYYHTLIRLKNKFNVSKIYNSNISKLLKPFPILPNQNYVENDSSNLVAFLDNIRDKYRDNFDAIENDLNKCIPEFSRIQFENIVVQKDDDLYKIYGDKTFKRLGLYDNVNKITYWADELSEGTLYFLALLCIVHQPNPPKLLLLEEPEKGIHPRRIKEVLDFIFQLAEEKDIQIILTTHNERVLDEFADIPEAVFVFDKDEEGATIVKNLQKDIIEPSDKEMEEKGYPKIKFTESLGSHWLTGFIGGVPR